MLYKIQSSYPSAFLLPPLFFPQQSWSSSPLLLSLFLFRENMNKRRNKLLSVQIGFVLNHCVIVQNCFLVFTLNWKLMKNCGMSNSVIVLLQLLVAKCGKYKHLTSHEANIDLNGLPVQWCLASSLQITTAVLVCGHLQYFLVAPKEASKKKSQKPE